MTYRDKNNHIVLTIETTCSETNEDGIHVYDIDYTVDSYGSMDSYMEPGDPAEITIYGIRKAGTEEKIEGSEFDRLSELFEPDICMMVYQDGPEPDDDY